MTRMARMNGSHGLHVDSHGSHAALARMLYTLFRNCSNWGANHTQSPVTSNLLESLTYMFNIIINSPIKDINMRVGKIFQNEGN